MGAPPVSVAHASVRGPICSPSRLASLQSRCHLSIETYMALVTCLLKPMRCLVGEGAHCGGSERLGPGEARRQGCRAGAASAAACGAGAAPTPCAEGVPTLHRNTLSNACTQRCAREESRSWHSLMHMFCIAQQMAASAASGLSPPSTANTSLVTTPSLTSEDAMSEEAVLGPRLTNAQRKNLRHAPWVGHCPAAPVHRSLASTAATGSG